VNLKYYGSVKGLALAYRSLMSRSGNQLLQTVLSMNEFMEGEDDQACSEDITGIFQRILYGLNSLCHKIPVSNGER
jgi:hypothetical protein